MQVIPRDVILEQACTLPDVLLYFTEKIFWILGKKHQNEFRLLVDQAKKGYKKTVEMSKKKVTKEEDGSTEKLLPVFVGKRL